MQVKLDDGTTQELHESDAITCKTEDETKAIAVNDKVRFPMEGRNETVQGTVVNVTPGPTKMQVEFNDRTTKYLPEEDVHALLHAIAGESVEGKLVIRCRNNWGGLRMDVCASLED